MNAYNKTHRLHLLNARCCCGRGLTPTSTTSREGGGPPPPVSGLLRPRLERLDPPPLLQQALLEALPLPRVALRRLPQLRAGQLLCVCVLLFFI